MRMFKIRDMRGSTLGGGIQLVRENGLPGLLSGGITRLLRIPIPDYTLPCRFTTKDFNCKLDEPAEII